MLHAQGCCGLPTKPDGIYTHQGPRASDRIRCYLLFCFIFFLVSTECASWSSGGGEGGEFCVVDFALVSCLETLLHLLAIRTLFYTGVTENAHLDLRSCDQFCGNGRRIGLQILRFGDISSSNDTACCEDINSSPQTKGRAFCPWV